MCYVQELLKLLDVMFKCLVGKSFNVAESYIANVLTSNVKVE